MSPHSLSLSGVLHLVYFGLILPYRTWRYRNVWPKADEPRRPRVEHYKAHVIRFLVHGVMSLIALFGLSRSVRSGLFPPAWPGRSSLLLGAVACAIMLAIDLAYSRRCFDRDAPHMYVSTPHTRQERWAWVGHSSLAGVTEELTWRGVQPVLIAQLTGQPWLAIVICAATFGIGHIRQGKLFVPIAVLFALMFHALTWLTGGLYVPMIVHVSLNVIVGLRAGTWVKT